MAKVTLKKTGPQVIDSMVGKFQGIVDGLDKGLSLCDTKKKQNDAKIAALNEENDFLADKSTMAVTFRDNLKAMLTKKVVPASDEENDRT